MGWKILGVEFVFTSPWQIIEALMILFWTLLFVLGGGVLMIMSVLSLFTPFALVTLALWGWALYDYRTPERGGRRIEQIRSWPIWKVCRSYFPVSLHRTAKLDPSRNYLFVYHPHGILGYGAFINFGTNAGDFGKLFPGLKPTPLVLKVQFLVPIIRDLVMSLGGCSCSSRSIEWLLTKQGTGNAIVIVVGGAPEALDAHPGTYNLTLKQREKFIRLAIEHGTPLVPVIGFGENDLFQQVANPPGSRLRALQTMFTKYFTFSTPLFWGRGIFNTNFGILPYRRPINVVVGSPMEVEKIANPTDEQVDDVLKRYMAHLTQLFASKKKSFDVPSNTNINFT